MRKRRVSENARRTPGALSEAEVKRMRGYPTTTLPKSTVTAGGGAGGSTGSGHTSLILVNAP